MTPEQEQEFNRYKEIVDSLMSSATLPYDFDSAIRDRFNLNIVVSLASALTGLSGILKVDNGVFTTITPLSGTKVYYVSDSSGGLVNRKLTFTNGVLTSQT